MLEDRLKDIAITKNDCDSGCTTTTYKEIDVTVPVTIEPFASFGEACVEIIDDPCIIPVPRCMRKNNCQYAIKQKLCVIFPIEFNAVATSGPPVCSLGDNCDNCDCEEFVSYEMKDKLKDEIKDKLKDELKDRIKIGILKVEKKAEDKDRSEIKKNEDELETLFSYKKLGNHLQILI